MNTNDDGKKPQEPAQELTEEQLKGISGGLMRRANDPPEKCGICGATTACNCLSEMSIER